MALIRHSPYSIPSPRFNSTMSTTTYDPHFVSGLAIPATGASSSESCSVALPYSSGMYTEALSDVNSAANSRPGMSYLSNINASDNSPYSPNSPNSPGHDFNTDRESSLITDPYNNTQCGAGCYSSSCRYPTSMLTGSHSPPPSLPTSPYPDPVPSTAMLPTPMYSPQDCSSTSFSIFSNSRSMPSAFGGTITLQPSCFSSAMPCLNMPMWSPYPSLPSIGPLPSTKLSYDSPRYKLTPERAIPLIKWFEEHKEHPYPTRQEKIVLCQSTQLTFTQVSTWFANARRRMKKANSSEEEDSSTQGSGSSTEQDGSPDCNLRL